MIVEKTGYADFYALDLRTGKRTRIPLNSYLTPRQQVMMAQDPDLIRAMAKHLAKNFQARGMADIQIEVDAFATLNGRSGQRLIRPGLDLAGPLPSDWILTLAR
jgi:hypothetical protein